VENMNKYFLMVILADGLVWLKSSYGKFSTGGFVEGIGGILAKFVAKNPNTWYVDFLKSVAIPNAQIFGTLVLWGELFVAVSLVLGPLLFLTRKKVDPKVRWLLKIGLLGGFLMNVNFYFAAGWMSPSTESLNMLMAVIELVGLTI